MDLYCKMKKMKSRVLILISVTIFYFTMTAAAFSQKMPEVDRIHTSAGDVEMFFIGHGSLMFRHEGFVIHIDPVSSSGNYEGLPAADLVLVTHEHYDHLDTDLIKKLRKKETVLICNPASAPELPGSRIMKAGDKVIVSNITIEAVPAYNIVHERAKGQPFHPKGSGNGYVISIADKRFYVAGDTENIPEMKNLSNIDVAFLPMNLPYTMTPEMVADAAKTFKPAILYPYHYGETNTGEIKRLLKDTGIEVRIRELK